MLITKISVLLCEEFLSVAVEHRPTDFVPHPRKKLMALRLPTVARSLLSFVLNTKGSQTIRILCSLESKKLQNRRLFGAEKNIF